MTEKKQMTSRTCWTTRVRCCDLRIDLEIAA